MPPPSAQLQALHTQLVIAADIACELTESAGEEEIDRADTISRLMADIATDDAQSGCVLCFDCADYDSPWYAKVQYAGHTVEARGDTATETLQTLLRRKEDMYEPRSRRA